MQMSYSLAIRNILLFLLASFSSLFVLYSDAELLAYFDTTSNVSDVASMDGDMAMIIQYLDMNPMDTNSAFNVYSKGRNPSTPTLSPTPDGSSTRSPTSVSTFPQAFRDMCYGSDIVTRLMKVPLFKTYAEYWKSQTYGDDFVMNALNSKGDFANAADVMRSECAKKGIQYQVVWMYISYKMTEAVESCKVSIPDALVAWDQAWALHTGSLEGPYALGKGIFLHSLGEINCVDFGTCVSKYTSEKRSSVNNKILSYFEAGRALIRVGDCDTAAVYITMFQKKSMVPFIQGTIRGAYKGDPKSGYVAQSTERNRAVGEAWAYAAALLPMVNMYNKQAASIIRDNMGIASPQRLQNGFKVIVASLQSVYSSLGISCGEIGALKDANGVVLVAACDDNDIIKIINDNGGPAVAVLVIFFIILVGIAVFCCFNTGYKRGFKAGQEDGPPPVDYFKNYKFPNFNRNQKADENNPTLNEDEGISPTDTPTSAVAGATQADLESNPVGASATYPVKNGNSSNGIEMGSLSSPSQQPPPPRPRRQSNPNVQQPPPQQQQQQGIGEEIATI